MRLVRWHGVDSLLAGALLFANNLLDLTKSQIFEVHLLAALTLLLLLGFHGVVWWVWLLLVHINNPKHEPNECLLWIASRFLAA